MGLGEWYFSIVRVLKKCKIDFKLGSVVFMCMNLEVFREINLSTKFKKNPSILILSFSTFTNIKPENFREYYEK